MKKLFLLMVVAVLLSLCVCAGAVEICGIEYPAQAEYIDLTGIRRTVNGKFLTASAQELNKAFAQMENLTRVDMWDWPLKREERSALLQNNERITFGWDITLNRVHHIRTDATAFSTLGKAPLLTYVNDLQAFSLCSDLRALDIGHCVIEKIDFLSDLPKLKVLILADTGIEDISPLKEQTEIEYLQLFLNNISDISPLAYLTNLQDVNLCFNKITDLSPLYNLPNLKRVWLTANKGLKQEEIDRLREHQPECEVVTLSDGATGNVVQRRNGKEVELQGTSWRHHPHYDTIYYIFNHGEYITWDDEIPARSGKK